MPFIGRVAPFALLFALAACQPAGDAALAPAPDETRATPGTYPESVRVAGEPEAVADVVRGLRAEGVNVAAYPLGREAGLRTVCSGQGEVLALASELTDAERSACAALGMVWSAGISASGRIVYVDYFWSENLFLQTAEF